VPAAGGIPAETTDGHAEAEPSYGRVGKGPPEQDLEGGLVNDGM
jgi:hypothetical protein